MEGSGLQMNVYIFPLNEISVFVVACRFYKLHERKVEPISMTVPRKVSHTQDT